MLCGYPNSIPSLLVMCYEMYFVVSFPLGMAPFAEISQADHEIVIFISLTEKSSLPFRLFKILYAIIACVICSWHWSWSWLRTQCKKVGWSRLRCEELVPDELQGAWLMSNWVGRGEGSGFMWFLALNWMSWWCRGWHSVWVWIFGKD